MKKALKRIESKTWYFVAGEKIHGVPPELRGDVSGLSGDVSGLRGDVSGLRGYVSELSGDVDACGISNKDREEGVDIASLIETA